MPSKHTYDLVGGDTQQPNPIWDKSAYQHQIPQSKTPASNEQYDLSEPHVNEVRSRSRRTWGWLYETSSLLVAAGCFGGIMALLFTVQDKPLPNWPSEITVNAILSVLVTIMKGALALTVTECLSQLKWSWFRTERRLVDLIIFDEASRSAWGAARLLFTLREWYLAYLGALMLVIAVILGPTVQQTVEVRVRLVDAVENATMPICNTSYFSMMGLGSGPGANKVNLPVVGAIYDGLMQTTLPSLAPGCPSGNCTFPKYQSLGIVAKCEDRTLELVSYKRGYAEDDFNTTLTPRECTEQVPVCETEWPGSGLLLAPYGTINSTVNGTVAVTAEDTAFYTWRGILGPGQTRLEVVPPPVAVECTLHFAVYTYAAEMTAGKLSESVVETFSAGVLNGSWDFSSSLTLNAEPCYSEACTYTVAASEGLSISNTLRPILTGEGSRTVSNRPYWSDDLLQAISGLSDGDHLEDPKVGSFEYVDRAFQSLASTLTNHARGSEAVCGGATVQGTQRREEVYLYVRWAWLVPIAVLFLFCLVFFVAVTVKFRGEDLWKSSPLAFLVARVSVDGRELGVEELRKLGGADGGVGRREVEKAANGVSVRLGVVR